MTKKEKDKLNGILKSQLAKAFLLEAVPRAIMKSKLKGIVDSDKLKTLLDQKNILEATVAEIQTQLGLPVTDKSREYSWGGL